MPPLSYAHFDADAFFASVEQAADRRLRGRAIAVGGKKRGIIASASYEARARGIFTPMPTAEALKRCPDLIVVSGHYSLYEQFSENIFALCEELTPNVERTSIDEGYMDLRPTPWRDTGSALSQLRKLDTTISQWMKITVSHGLAANKLVAAIASKSRKPHGFVVVPEGAEKDFLAPLPLRHLPGLGPRTISRLSECGWRLIGDLQTLTSDQLRPLLGRQTPVWQKMARGEDDRRLVTEPPPAKTFSHQQTFASDQSDEAGLLITGRMMLDQLMTRVRADKVQVRTLSLQIRYTDREDVERSESLPEPSDLETEFYPLLKPLLQRAWQRRVRLRMIGLRLSNIYRCWPQVDFLQPQREKQRILAHLIDRINEEQGLYTVQRAYRLTKPSR